MKLDIGCLNEMITMQHHLDRVVEKRNGENLEDIFNGNQKDRWLCAILDEIGELNHEVKKYWCWWKKSQQEVNQDKALEELVDIWHFVLMKCESEFYIKPLILKDNLYILDYINKIIENNNVFSYPEALKMLVSFISSNKIDGRYEKIQLLACVILLSTSLSFSIEDVLKEYKLKNEINIKRQESDY